MVVVADVDGDGDPDPLIAFGDFDGDSKVAWYENMNGQGSYGPQQEITTETFLANSVATADVDGDGDLDVFSASMADGKVAWYENTDSQGNFGPQRIISVGDSALSVTTGDVDGDGDLDVLSGWFEGSVTWHENTDAQGTFGPRRVITTDTYPVDSVAAADVDGDGDLDVLSASWEKVAWYENTDGLGSFGSQQVITTEADFSHTVTTTDVDGDGDLDVLSASSNDNKIAWYENTDGQGNFGPQRLITTEAQSARSVATGDVDGDGDQDVLSASVVDDKIAWYENTDGRGSFGPEQLIDAQADRAASVATADVDGDGDLDVLSASFGGKVAWYEQRLLGDVNDDVAFDSSDLVRVFQAGEYEDGVDGNSSFDDGDWNGDGDFNSSDLVLAFQAGHYVAAATPAASDVAAAVDWLFAQAPNIGERQDLT